MKNKIQIHSKPKITSAYLIPSPQSVHTNIPAVYYLRSHPKDSNRTALKPGGKRGKDEYEMR